MNDLDKDLISAYLDNETTADESKHVESLMESNTEALNYANQLKSANLEINQYFEGQEFEELEDSVDKFMSDNIGLADKTRSIFDFNINKFFNPYSISGYVATAIIFFSINLNFFSNENFSNENLIPSDSMNFLKEFSEESFSYSIPKFRGDSNLNEIYIEAIERMLEEKKLSLNLLHGDESFVITIENQIYSKDLTMCFTGTIIKQNSFINYLFCENDLNSSILLDD